MEEQHELQAVAEILADPNCGTEEFTVEDWRLATKRAKATRRRVLADGRTAEIAERKYTAIVERSPNIKKSTGPAGA